MQLSGEVDDEEVLKLGLAYLCEHLDRDQFVEILRIVFKSKSNYVRDAAGLAIDHINDPYFLNVLKEAINNEKVMDLKKDLEHVANYLEKHTYDIG